jgi:hypothetical protein
MEGVLDTGRELLDLADSFNATFAEHGWVAHDRMNSGAAARALCSIPFGSF